jgi:hypothetical protein
LTEQQWNVRFAEFAAKLQSLEAIDVPEGNWQKWKDSLARGLGIAAIVALHHSRAKDDLVSYGWPKDQVEEMAAARVILLHIGQTFEITRDDLFKWLHLPYWQAHAGTEAAEKSLAKHRRREILPLASLLLPAISNARFAVVRLDRELAAIRNVEALRLHAAKHGGKLPATLDEVSDVPLPLDPVTGRMFEYRLEGQMATLEGKAPAGRTPENGAFRYEIAISGDEAVKKQDGPPPSRKPDSPK